MHVGVMARRPQPAGQMGAAGRARESEGARGEVTSKHRRCARRRAPAVEQADKQFTSVVTLGFAATLSPGVMGAWSLGAALTLVLWGPALVIVPSSVVTCNRRCNRWRQRARRVLATSGPLRPAIRIHQLMRGRPPAPSRLWLQRMVRPPAFQRGLARRCAAAAGGPRRPARTTAETVFGQIEKRS
jgi:hypothetical protein